MSRAHLEPGSARTPPGKGSAPPGRQQRRGVGGGLVNFARSPSPSRALLASCLCSWRAAPQPRSPRSSGRALVGERADPRARRSKQGSATPSSAAPRARISLPVSGRSETRAVTRPKSDSAVGPISRRPGSRGGGAEAGRGPRGAGSLREAQPRGGLAGGGEVELPWRRAGANRVRMAVSPARRPMAERGGVPGPGVYPTSHGWLILVVGSTPGRRRSPWTCGQRSGALLEGSPEKQGIAGHRAVPKCVFSPLTPFTQDRDSSVPSNN